MNAGVLARVNYVCSAGMLPRTGPWAASSHIRL